jgi:hypothetical protein
MSTSIYASMLQVTSGLGGADDPLSALLTALGVLTLVPTTLNLLGSLFINQVRASGSAQHYLL